MEGFALRLAFVEGRLGAECSRLSARFRGVAISGGHGLDTNAKGSVIRSISPELQLDKGALCRVFGRPVSDCGTGASTHGAMAFSMAGGK